MVSELPQNREGDPDVVKWVSGAVVCKARLIQTIV